MAVRRKRRQDPALPSAPVIDAAVTIFSVIAHAPRLRVLVALARRGPMAAGELQQVAGLEQTAQQVGIIKAVYFRPLTVLYSA